MSKYNLTDILNEYVGGSRHGTINISYRDLQDAMDKIEADGDFVVRELSGPSGDGKVNREFEVVFIGAARGDNKQEEAGFTVYDYKFGFDPASENNFDEVLPFSIGGNNKEAALKIAKYLLGNNITNEGNFNMTSLRLDSTTVTVISDMRLSLSERTEGGLNIYQKTLILSLDISKASIKRPSKIYEIHGK